MTKSAEELKEMVKTNEATPERHKTLWNGGMLGVNLNIVPCIQVIP